ncbi:WD40-repeat-containing domain protein [Diplogelasinospora grovesii]|uniref:WD40-repeat-containing domain protein n=1 Tax=Diplogelasinospora grovesii TaxID=303347 RepID=A0AAN6NI12_9PEZI|nr:WD40-repeat-containing domain protein [Diplogelasinospora grovesii]
MPSFFTVPGAEKKRKRPSAQEAPKKRLATSKSAPKSAGKGPAKSAPAKEASAAIERDESISGSDLDSDDDVRDADTDRDEDDSENEGETAAEKRLRLAQRYLEKTKNEVELEVGWDAADVDRDYLAERLQYDVAESKGKVYRKLASKLAFPQATHTQFKWNSKSVTSVSVCAPYAYTGTTDGYLTKWKLQDLLKDQWPQTTKRKPKKPPAPPKKKPEMVKYRRPDPRKAKDRSFQGHTAGILAVKASADGKFVVTGGADRRLVVHDAATLKPLRAFTQHRDAITGLAFRRGTNQLFSCSKDRTVKVWSLDELTYVETLFGHQDDVVDIDALAQERCVSVGARDRTARWWKVPEESQLVFRGGGPGESKKNRASLPEGTHKDSLAHEGSMDRVAMIDDSLFVTGSDNGALALWSVQKKKPLFVLPRAHGIDPPLPPSAVSGDADPDPKLVPPPQPRWITALRTIPYSDVILSGSWDGYVRVWRLSEDKKKIEPVGVLGGGSTPAAPVVAVANGMMNGHGHAETTSAEGDDAVEEGNNNKQDAEAEAELENNGQHVQKQAVGPIRGIINDIAMFERGDRGKDGLCVVVATGKEMRLGRWKQVPDGRCGAVVFEVPTVSRDVNGQEGDVSEDEAEEDEES